MSKIVGYARVSTHYQNLDSQIFALKQYGCTKIYTEKESGRNIKRKELDRAISTLKKGDTFVTFKLDRLSRGTKHLLTLMDYFHENDINFISIQNNIDTRTSMGKFFFTVMSAFSEMEADLIRDRVLSGLENAKQNGKKLGRPPLDKNEQEVIHQYLTTDKTITVIAKENDISRPTVYKYLKKNNVSLKKTK
ncbi:recombinase family protein [Enterococcus faecium]|nr:recombinase family protein [Enterococcus faecium]EME8124445.1 recombinase family protein [Enterococcus faecium]